MTGGFRLCLSWRVGCRCGVCGGRRRGRRIKLNAVMTNLLVPQPTQRTNTTNMGASQGKSKKEQKEEAREWARTKENEVAELYTQNTELRNQILMMQEDMRALRDMLKGQQSALNESVKQMNERMTEMENDVKVVPFGPNPTCIRGEPSPRLAPFSSISSQGEQEIYYRNEIRDENDDRAWEKEEKRQTQSTHFVQFGRVYSLKQFEKVFVDELKFKKITQNQFQEKRKIQEDTHYSVYIHGIPKNGIFPSLPYKPHKFIRLEPETPRN